jgi:hypothetical protein
MRELRQIKTQMEQGSNESVMKNSLDKYKETFADFGRGRRRMVLHHLEQLKQLLLPTQVTKMTMWSLHQDDDFYVEKSGPSDSGTIWSVLCKTMDVRVCMRGRESVVVCYLSCARLCGLVCAYVPMCQVVYCWRKTETCCVRTATSLVAVCCRVVMLTAPPRLRTLYAFVASAVEQRAEESFGGSASHHCEAAP